MLEDKSIVLYWHYGRKCGEFTKNESSEAICSLRLILKTVLANTWTIMLCLPHETKSSIHQKKLPIGKEEAKIMRAIIPDSLSTVVWCLEHI